MTATARQAHPSRVAVLDVASNSAHLQVADVIPGKPPWPVREEKWRTGLADGADRAGKIKAGAMRRLAATVNEAVSVAEDCGAEELIAVTTSAVRDAPNRDRVIAYVRAASGVRLDVLSGTAEARLEFLAVRRWHGWSAGPLLLLNVGSGSLKIAFGHDERPEMAISLPLGTRQLAGTFLRSDPPRRAELWRLLRHVTRRLSGAVGELDIDSGLTAVATSRTSARLARLTGAPKPKDGSRVPCRLDAAVLGGQLRELISRNDAQRAELPGFSRTRARQMLAGAIVADTAMTALNLRYVDICPWALREGVLLDRSGIPVAAAVLGGCSLRFQLAAAGCPGTR